MDRATRQGVALRESSSQTRRGNVRKTVGEHETVATASELNNIVRGTEGTCFSHCVCVCACVLLLLLLSSSLLVMLSTVIFSYVFIKPPMRASCKA